MQLISSSLTLEPATKEEFDVPVVGPAQTELKTEAVW